MVYSAANGNDDDEIAVSPKYYCPVSGCKYNYCSGQPTKSFSTARLLKQHHIKVHTDKIHKCDMCNKGFPLESTLKAHRVMCGVMYYCYCGHHYNSPEAFLTHTKRRGHNIGLAYSTIMKLLKSRKLFLSKSKESNTTEDTSKKSAQLPIITSVQSLSDSSTQTTFENKDYMLGYADPKLSSASSSPIRRLCAQTQTDPTGDCVIIKTDPMFLDSETQTNFDFLNIYTQTAESERLFGDLEFTNIHTQTNCTSLFNDDGMGNDDRQTSEL